MSVPGVQYRLLDGFDDPSISPELWNALLSRGSTDEIFLTWHYQKAWWDAFCRGTLLLAVAESQGELRMIAPCFAEAGMVYFVGSGGSDYLDFIGDLTDASVLKGLISFVLSQVDSFAGFQFFHVPGSSPTSNCLAALAETGSWKLEEEGEWICPYIGISNNGDLDAASRRKSLLRHEAFFARNGGFRSHHGSRLEEIAPYLDEFFDQHVERWSSSRFPSLFTDPRQRYFYLRLVEIASDTNWLRFTRIEWEDQPIAFHFGFMYGGRFLWYKPSFNVKLEKHSPGEVLFRQLLLLAAKDGAQIFDLGLGNERFKTRFATSTRTVKVWGFYPKTVKKVLVVSPHPDDEAIGCGGTLEKHRTEGDVVEIIFLSSGEGGGHGRSPNETVRMREEEAREAASILGISMIDFWRLADGCLGSCDEIAVRLTEKFRAVRPDIVYVPHEKENHPDHRAAAGSVRQALASLEGEIPRPDIRMFEVWTPLLKVDHIEDISRFAETKRRAIRAYRSQCEHVKFDEAILGLNRYRGELYCWPGGDYAEVFEKMS